MTEVKHASIADDDVQAQTQQHVNAEEIRHISPIRVSEQGHTKPPCSQQDERPPVMPVPNIAQTLFHTLSATRSPSSPVGRQIRIKIRMAKEMASFKWQRYNLLPGFLLSLTTVRQSSPRDITDSAHDGSREGPDPISPAHGKIDLPVIKPNHQPGRRSQSRTDHEHQHDDFVDIDPH